MSGDIAIMMLLFITVLTSDKLEDGKLLEICDFSA